MKKIKVSGRTSFIYNLLILKAGDTVAPLLKSSVYFYINNFRSLCARDSRSSFLLGLVAVRSRRDTTRGSQKWHDFFVVAFT